VSFSGATSSDTDHGAIKDQSLPKSRIDHDKTDKGDSDRSGGDFPQEQVSCKIKNPNITVWPLAFPQAEIQELRYPYASALLHE
jgi:hypothetical protein